MVRCQSCTVPHRSSLVVALLLGLAGGASAQRRPPPPPPRILIEPHQARMVVPLTGLLDGPAAVDADGRVTFLADDGVVGQVARDGNLRWSFLAGPPGGEPALAPDGTVYCAGRDGRLYAISSD